AALQIEILEHRFDDHVGGGEARVVGGAGDHVHQPVDVGGRAPLAGHVLVEDLAHVAQAGGDAPVVDVLDAHGDAGLGGRDRRDAAAHEPTAQHTNLLDRSDLRLGIGRAVLFLERL